MKIMNPNRSLCLLAYTLWILIAWSCQSPEINPEPQWTEVTNTAKPWTRWWWHGSAVTKEGITAELESFQQAGLGGVEITPIFGVKGQEDKFVNFLSEQWVDLLIHTLQEADRLGLGVDMATGTGWPFGGPWIDAAHAPKNMVFKTWTLTSGQRLSENIQCIQEPMLRAVNRKVDISEVKNPISANQNLQELAFDQVKFEEVLPLIAVVAYDETGNSQELTHLVKENQLDWTAPEGNWTLYGVFQGLHGKMVERAAPGGEGNVIDHFSKEALQIYLNRFDEAFAGRDLKSLRAFFNDSYEVDDARGQADFTPGFFEIFETRRGYDLKAHLPALLGKTDEVAHARVLTDYRVTIAELIQENFTKPWKKWGASHGAIIRNQAHGSPANILDLYAEVDIPETEGDEMLKIKFASSAAHVNGKPLTSSESATWLKDHFQSNLADIRRNLERYQLGGVNHVFYHGTAYSPDEEVWPGWLFYAAVHANDRNPLWQDMTQLNLYITRIQSMLQASSPDNDLLVYFPVYDRYAESGHGLLEHFDIRGNFYHSQVKLLGDTLLQKGISIDLISDQQLTQLRSVDGQLQTKGGKYRAILIPATHYMPLATMQKLKELADAGAKVLFYQNLPQDVPGMYQLPERQVTLRTLKEAIQPNAVVASRLDQLMESANILPETLVQNSLPLIRKQYKGKTLYFICNWTDSTYDDWAPLQKVGSNAYLLNPMTGVKGVAQVQNGKVRLQLAAGESVIVLTDDKPFEGSDYPNYRKGNTQVLNNDWQVHFEKGGPELPADTLLEKLTSWTKWGIEATEYFSGSAVYTTTFVQKSEAPAYQLSLGAVHESAQVFLNGKLLQTLIGPTYEVTFSAAQLQEVNELKVVVSNLMANRIRYMDLKGIEYRRFYNINFPAHDAENRRDGLFHADHWESLPSGLLGPVTLTALHFEK